MAETFKIVPLPDPESWAFVVKASTQDLRFDPPKLGTLYKDIGIGERKRACEGDWGEYRYAQLRPSQDDGMVELLFVPPGKVDDKGNPKPFRVTPSYEDYDGWPPMLEDLPSGDQIDFNVNYGYPITVNIATSPSTNGTAVITPRVHPAYLMRPAWTGSTRMEVREYISDKPFPEEFIQASKPIATTIRFELVGQLNPDVRELTCLHREVRVPDFGESQQIDLTSSASKFFPTVMDGITYAETNMTEWQDHVIYAHQEWNNGVWYLQKKIAYAPPMEPLISTL